MSEILFWEMWGKVFGEMWIASVGGVLKRESLRKIDRR